MSQQGCQTGDNSLSLVTFQIVLVAIETSYLSLEFGPFQGHFNLFFHREIIWSPTMSFCKAQPIGISKLKQSISKAFQQEIKRVNKEPKQK